MVLDKWKLFKLLGYEVRHEEVRRFHNSKARIRVCCAPRRTTKSYSAAKEVLTTVLTPNTLTWIVGPSYALAEKEFRYIHDDLVIKGESLGLPKPQICLFNPRSGDLYIKFPWGAILEGKSADRPNSLLGDAVDAVIYAEAAQLSRSIRERYVAPTLNTTQGYEIIPTTPAQSAEWVHELWMHGQEGEFPEIDSFSWDVTANPIYNMNDYNQAKKLYGVDSPVFREQYLGEWVFYGGVVYKSFNPNLHIIKPFDIPHHWPRIRAIDFGMRDPFVCLWGAVGPYNEIYLYREYYSKDGGLPLRHHTNQIMSLSKGERIGMTVGDPSEAQSIEDMCFEGLPVTSANNDRAAGRSRVSDYLLPTQDGPPPYPIQNTSLVEARCRWPRLYFFDTLIETCREIRYYRWKEKQKDIIREGEIERTEGDDHAMDTLRYMLMTRPSPFQSKHNNPVGSFNYWMNKIKRNNSREEYIKA